MDSVPVGFEVRLVPDMYGRRACTTCHGYGWDFGFHLEHEDCSACKGNGYFSEETIVVRDGQIGSYRYAPSRHGEAICISCKGHGWNLEKYRLGHQQEDCEECEGTGAFYLDVERMRLPQLPLSRIGDQWGDLLQPLRVKLSAHW